MIHLCKLLLFYVTLVILRHILVFAYEPVHLALPSLFTNKETHNAVLASST